MCAFLSALNEKTRAGHGFLVIVCVSLTTYPCNLAASSSRVDSNKVFIIYKLETSVRYL